MQNLSFYSFLSCPSHQFHPATLFMMNKSLKLRSVLILFTDERILEYDIDEILFDQRSPFQKVQIVHSKSLGNMLVLDELQSKPTGNLRFYHFQWMHLLYFFRLIVRYCWGRLDLHGISDASWCGKLRRQGYLHSRRWVNIIFGSHGSSHFSNFLIDRLQAAMVRCCMSF